MQDIMVIINLDTAPPPRSTLLPLLLSSTGVIPYTEHDDLIGIKEAHAPHTELIACATALFGQAALSLGPIERCAVFGVPADADDAGVVAALTELTNQHNDWYYLLPVKADASRIQALAKWAAGTIVPEAELRAGEIEAERLLVAQTDDKDIDCTDAQTALCYNPLPLESYMHAAWVGRVAPNYPKSATWKWKELRGVPVADLAGRGLHKLLARNINAYVEQNKRRYMAEGKCTDGEYIDVVIGRWQLKRALRERLTAYFVGNEVVPYDNEGFARVGAQVIGALEQAATDGVILSVDGKGAYSVAIPTRGDATRDQEAARTMPDIRWSATLRGGIHGTTVRGTLSVSMPN